MYSEQPGQRMWSWKRTPAAAERLFGVWAVRGGLTQTNPDYWTPPRTIAYHEPHIVLSGHLDLRPEGRPRLYVNPGDLVCLFPGISYEYGARPGFEPPRMLWLGLAGPAAADLVGMIGLTLDAPVRRGLRSQPFLGHLDALRTVEDDGPGHRQLVSVEFVARFVGEVLGQLDGPDGRPPSRVLASRGRELIDLHYASGVTVADVADRLNVDRSYFSKAFTRQFGEAPGSRLRRLRMTRARELLRETDLSVTHVALSIGYREVTAFSHSYRRYFGISPTADRSTETDIAT